MRLKTWVVRWALLAIGADPMDIIEEAYHQGGSDANCSLINGLDYFVSAEAATAECYAEEESW